MMEVWEVGGKLSIMREITDFKLEKKKFRLGDRANVGNDLLRASYEIGVVERRVLYLLISKLSHREEVETNKITILPIEEYATLLKIPTYEAFRVLSLAIDALADCKITLYLSENKKVREIFSWFNWAKIDEEQGIISVEWNSQAREFLEGLGADKLFTRLYVEDIIKTHSKYSSRLFDLLSIDRWKTPKGGKIITTILVENLIDFWKIPESCQVFSELNRTILKPAMKELQEQGLVLGLSMETIRQGRRVKEVKFITTWPKTSLK